MRILKSTVHIFNIIISLIECWLFLHHSSISERICPLIILINIITNPPLPIVHFIAIHILTDAMLWVNLSLNTSIILRTRPIGALINLLIKLLVRFLIWSWLLLNLIYLFNFMGLIGSNNLVRFIRFVRVVEFRQFVRLVVVVKFSNIICFGLLAILVRIIDLWALKDFPLNDTTFPFNIIPNTFIVFGINSQSTMLFFQPPIIFLPSNILFFPQVLSILIPKLFI